MNSSLSDHALSLIALVGVGERCGGFSSLLVIEKTNPEIECSIIESV